MLKMFKPKPIFPDKFSAAFKTQPSPKAKSPNLQKAAKSRPGEDDSAHAVPMGLLAEPPLHGSRGSARRADGGSHGDGSAVSDRRWAVERLHLT